MALHHTPPGHLQRSGAVQKHLNPSRELIDVLYAAGFYIFETLRHPSSTAQAAFTITAFLINLESLGY